MPSLVSVMPRLERSKMVTPVSRSMSRAATDRLDWDTYSVCAAAEMEPWFAMAMR